MSELNALEVEGLNKVYPAFTLKDINFRVREGRIAGLIGRNGAGKSTTIKAIMGLISSTGAVKVFGKALSEVKEQVGYVGGGFRFYQGKTLGAIAKSVASFYAQWDGGEYERLMDEFGLMPSKRVRELSEGMKVKFALALALSHGARLLILDEPTSGLDPLSREELCDELLALKRRGVSVLFSTHITNDLMRVADQIIYLSGGSLLACEPLETLQNRYHIAIFPTLGEARAARAIGVKQVRGGFEGLCEYGEKATLDQIMIHLEYARKESV